MVAAQNPLGYFSQFATRLMKPAASKSPAKKKLLNDCCVLEDRILHSATALPIDIIDQVDDSWATEDEPPHNYNFGASVGPTEPKSESNSHSLLGAELERILDDHWQSMNPDYMDSPIGDIIESGGAEAAGSEGEFEASLKREIVRGILAADDTLTFDPESEKFFRAARFGSVSASTTVEEVSACSSSLTVVESAYESLLLGFLVSAVVATSQKDAKPKSDRNS